MSQKISTWHQIFRCVSFLVLTLILGCNMSRPGRIDQIQSLRKAFWSSNGYVLAQGRWKVTAGAAKHVTVRQVNTTTISCNKSKMTCTEILGEVVTPREADALSAPVTTSRRAGGLNL